MAVKKANYIHHYGAVAMSLGEAWKPLSIRTMFSHCFLLNMLQIDLRVIRMHKLKFRKKAAVLMIWSKQKGDLTLVIESIR